VIRGRTSGESIQRGLNLEGMGPRFSAYQRRELLGNDLRFPKEKFGRKC